MKTINETIWKSVAVGAIAGLAGAWVMNEFQSLLSRLSQSGQQPPGKKSEEESEDATVKTAEAISKNLFQHELTDEEKRWAGAAVHYGFGATMGGLYGALTEMSPAASAGFGTGYGTAVWAVADEMGVSALGLAPPIPDTDFSSHVKALAAHLVYGFTTDLARRGILKLARN